MAAAPKKLAKFTFSESEEGYVLHIEAEGGDKLDLEATPEQLDAIIDGLDDLLSEDEEEIFAADDGEIEDDGDEDRPNA
jgi:hypothetical protein